MYRNAFLRARGEKVPEAKATEAEENELWEQEALESLYYEVSEEEICFFRETRAAARAGKALDGLIKDDKSGDDRSRLLSAAEKGYQATVAYLLLHGAEPDHAVDQWTPLHGAAAFGEAGCVALLLLKGAKTEIAGPQGCTPLHLAVRDGWDPGREAIASMLIGAGANINAQDSAGETPLCYAVRTGGGAVRFFMEHGADLSIKGNEGSPLDIARKMGHEFARRQLESAGAK
jgi:ankyrin repeat protein